MLEFPGIFYWPSWLDEAGFRGACLKIESVLDALCGGLRGEDCLRRVDARRFERAADPRTTEFRPGTYVFYDTSRIEAKACVEADCALRVLTTVVSTSVPGQCVIDAGSRTLSIDQTVPLGTFGLVVGRPWTIRKTE